MEFICVTLLLISAAIRILMWLERTPDEWAEDVPKWAQVNERDS